MYKIETKEPVCKITFVRFCQFLAQPPLTFSSFCLLHQAELISLGRTDVDSQYVLARETLHKWHSESNCYLLIRDLHTDLMVSSSHNYAIFKLTTRFFCPNSLPLTIVKCNHAAARRRRRSDSSNFVSEYRRYALRCYVRRENGIVG